MIITKEELQAYTGVEFEDGNNIADLFIGSAQDIVQSYLGYEIEEKEYTKHFVLHNSNIIKVGVKHISEVDSITVDNNAVTNYYIEDDKIILNQPVTSENIVVSFTAGFDDDSLPYIMKLTVLRISALLQEESNNNIGITSKSFVNEGTRTFSNYTNFDKFLLPISKYKLI